MEVKQLLWVQNLGGKGHLKNCNWHKPYFNEIFKKIKINIQVHNEQNIKILNKGKITNSAV